MRNEVIERVLALGEAGSGESAGLAPATISAVRQLTDELQPLVGTLATRALYLRVLHLAGAGFHRPGPNDPDTLDMLLAALALDLDQREPEDAGRAARALLRSMVDLLVSLMGESLTYQLLRRAWSIPASTQPIEDEPRQ